MILNEFHAINEIPNGFCVISVASSYSICNPENCTFVAANIPLDDKTFVRFQRIQNDLPGEIKVR